MTRPAPPRSVRSALAAQRALARAGTSWGDVVAIPRAPKPADPTGTPPAAVATAPRGDGRIRPATDAVPRAAAPAPAPAPVRVAAAALDRSERRLLLGLVAALGAFVVLLGSVGVERGLDRRASRQAMGGALNRSAFVQAEFHARNRRFARLAELEANGFVLPAGFEVMRASAGASHWYLKLRDPSTQVICERIGQLLEDPAEDTGTCRDADASERAAPAPS
jgi:hypothetical protein